MAKKNSKVNKMASQKIIAWNVNGLRAVAGKGFFEWLDKEAPDVVCLQEVKCQPEHLGELIGNSDGLGLFKDESSAKPRFGYHTYLHSAQKPGYSGVAIFTKQEPQDVKIGIGIREIDSEGRVLTARMKDFSVVSAYFPNSQRDHTRLGYKLDFCKEILKYCEGLRKKGETVVLCGDYNIAHQEIDLKNPQANKDNAGFLPEERAWMSEFISKGWIDTFRHFVKDPGHYSWWSYRPGIRERNIGWRIDYHCVNKEALSRVQDAFIMPHVYGSDHCPVGIELAPL